MKNYCALLRAQQAVRRNRTVFRRRWRLVYIKVFDVMAMGVGSGSCECATVRA